jgi:hypothetical protein
MSFETAKATPRGLFWNAKLSWLQGSKFEEEMSMQARGFIFKTGSSEATRLLKYDLSN